MNFSTGANLGDCLWSLQFLRKLGGDHAFYCQSKWLPQLRELMMDTAIQLYGLESIPGDSVDTWIANGRFEEVGFSYNNSGLDIIGYVMEYFNHVGGLAGMPCPLFTSRDQWLFDFPLPAPQRIPRFDVLMINAQPTSGQCPEFDNAHLNTLIERLSEHLSVICTNPTTARHSLTLNSTVRRIADYSMNCSMIIGVATGPIWTTFNTRNRHVRRHVLLSPLYLDYGPGISIKNHGNVGGLERALTEEGWI